MTFLEFTDSLRELAVEERKPKRKKDAFLRPGLVDVSTIPALYGRFCQKYPVGSIEEGLRRRVFRCLVAWWFCPSKFSGKKLKMLVRDELALVFGLEPSGVSHLLKNIEWAVGNDHTLRRHITAASEFMEPFVEEQVFSQSDDCES